MLFPFTVLPRFSTDGRRILLPAQRRHSNRRRRGGAPMSCRPALASPPPTSVAVLRRPHSRRRRIYLGPTCASGPSARQRGATAPERLQPRLVAAQSPPALAAGVGVRRDAETGLAILLVVLAAVLTFSLSLIILSFSAHKAIKKLETKAKKLAEVVAEEVPGTLSSLKLSFLEINDLTSQLQKLR